MKNYLIIVLGVMFAVGTSQMVFAGEHGGKEHGGKTHTQEHGGEAKGSTQEPTGEAKADSVKAPSNSDIRDTMEAYVNAVSEASGTFNINDPETGKTLNLSLVKVHKRIGKTGNYYYSCADFKDVNTGETYDLDLDVKDKGGTLSVVEIRIHKVAGDARYTYDDDDNRIALKGVDTYLGGISMPRIKSNK